MPALLIMLVYGVVKDVDVVEVVARVEVDANKAASPLKVSTDCDVVGVLVAL